MEAFDQKLSNKITDMGFVRACLVVSYFVFGVLSSLMYLTMAGVFNAAVASHATDAYYVGKTGVTW